MESLNTCPLCERLMDRDDEDLHHLIPKQKGGAKGPTVALHRFCHTKIHSLFTNAELKKSYSTIAALREHPEMVKFIEWVKDKESGFYMKNSEAKTRKKRRR